MRQIPVAVLDRVGEHVVRTARRAGVARVAVAAVRGQRQLAEAALDRRVQRRRVVKIQIGIAGRNARYHRPVGAQNVNAAHRRGRPNRRDHVAGLRRELTHSRRIRVGMRRRHVVDDVDHQAARRRAVAVGIRHHHRKARAARRINQRIVDQRIAVGDHPGARRRIVGERRRQRAGRPIRKRLRRAGQNVTAQRDHRHPVQRGERDRPRHRLRRVAVVGRIAVRNLARARRLRPTRRKAVLENRRRRSARRRDRVGRNRIRRNRHPADCDAHGRGVEPEPAVRDSVGEDVIYGLTGT